MEILRPDDPQEVGEYRLEGRLGAGGFGVVFAATRSDGRKVAIKVLRPELSDDAHFRQRLGREGQALTRIEGARVARVFEVVTDGPDAYLVMERIEGGNLEEHVRDNGPLQGPLLWAAAQGLTEALADIHSGGIVHRDLKPSNVMYGPEGIKVLDFGISLAAEDTGLTETGAFVGTAAWISPEQVNGEDVSTKTDVFGLGLVLAFAASGEHPYGSGRADAVMYRITHNEPNLSSVPEQIRRTLEMCLQKDPALRPSVKQLIGFFESNGEETFSGGTSATRNIGSHLDPERDSTRDTRAVASSFSTNSASTPNRKLVMAVVGAILAVGVVAAAVILPRRGTESATQISQTTEVNEQIDIEPTSESSSPTTSDPSPPTTSLLVTPTSLVPPVTTTTPEISLVAPSTTTPAIPKQDSQSGTAVPATTQPPTPSGPVAALTGQSTTDEISRAAIVAKIDNAEAARPQAGINQADIVFESLVEGNLTRFAAVFHSQDAGSIGPIRSIRQGDFDLVSNLNYPLFVHSGGNSNVMSSLKDLQVVRADLIQFPYVYLRDNNARPPHDLYSYSSGLYQHLGSQGNKPPALFSYRANGQTVRDGVEQTKPVTVNFGGVTVTYSWNATLNGWLRRQNGTIHRDHLGQSVAPGNVIIQLTHYDQSPTYPYTPTPRLIGEGEVWVLTEGQVVTGRWSRVNAEAITTYRATDGNEIRLTPGRTWVAFARAGTVAR